jgi:hypothetical protein
MLIYSIFTAIKEKEKRKGDFTKQCELHITQALAASASLGREIDAVGCTSLSHVTTVLRQSPSLLGKIDASNSI